MARRYGGCKPLAPIGPNGEAVVDLLVSDALSSGFGRIIMVVHPESGPAIRYHVERSWPTTMGVAFATQRLPLGTVHAVLAAKGELDPDEPFAVSNADDVYSEAAMTLLVQQLGSNRDEHALIGYRLQNTIATNDPVTRGICRIDGKGYLAALTERRQIIRQSPGDNFRSEDGVEPVELDGRLPTSVNLWGFQPAIWELLGTAMSESGLDEAFLLDEVTAGRQITKAEVLLPEVVAGAVAGDVGLPVRVVTTDAKLLGVTHAADLPAVTSELARQVAWGIRASHLWRDPS